MGLQKTYCCVFLCILNVLICQGKKEVFKHHVDVDDDDIGRLRLQSEGRFSDIIHLDTEKTIKRLLCRHNKIMIAFEDSATLPTWRPGQIVLGGSKWACVLDPEAGGQHNGIYAKIQDVYHPKDQRLDLQLQSVGPFDLLDEASIHFHYSPRPGRHVNAKRRTKRSQTDRKFVDRASRSTSNMLTDILNRIDWHANVSMFVPFNYDPAKRSHANQFSLVRNHGSEEMAIKTRSFSSSDLLKPPDYFTLDCISCSSVARLVYTFDLKIDKKNNKPVLKKYISQVKKSDLFTCRWSSSIKQVEAEVAMHTDFALRFRDEMTVNSSLLFWKALPKELMRIPVAVVPGLPPVELLLSYDMDIIAHVQAAVNGPSVLRNVYTAKGSYTFSQTMATVSAVQGDVSVANWTVRPSSALSMLPSLANVNTTFQHRMGFNSSLIWSGKDVSISLAPQADITLKPEVSNVVESGSFGKCLRSDMTMGGNFTIQDAYFHVQAFGLEIWNKYLASGYKHSEGIVSGRLGEMCKARCVGPLQSGPPGTLEEVCGPSVGDISRNHIDFSKRFRRVTGDFVVFQPIANDSHCDACLSCDHSTKRLTEICSERLVSPALAASLAQLQTFVNFEYSDRRLLVLEGWDEVTPRFPDGRHNTTSPYRDGRAMLIALSDKLSSRQSNQTSLYRRLSQMAVCSGFRYVAMTSREDLPAIEVGVEREDNINVTTDTGIPDPRQFFDKAMAAAGTQSMSCDASTNPTVGTTYPRAYTPESRCGPGTGSLDFLSPFSQSSLYEYPYDDVTFSPEGPTGNWCGHQLRPCISCVQASGSGAPWDRCITRMMTPRLALRLRRMAKLAAKESLHLLVQEALSVDTEAGSSPSSSLYREGRAAKISLLKASTTTKIRRLFDLAVCAGFDFVRYTDADSIEVFVRRQDGFTESREYFPSGRGLLGVQAPENMTEEYRFPAELSSEARQPPLLDGHNTAIPLSKYYTVSDFKDIIHRDFRLDTALVECLEEACEELGRKVEVVPGSAYRVRSINLENLDTRHPEEKFRYQAGQAVSVNLGARTDDADLVRLGKALLRRCTPFLQQQQRSVGIGCHQDRLYVDVRPVLAGDETSLVRVWNAGGHNVYDKLNLIADYVNKGGPLIVPIHRPSVCSPTSIVSQDKFYLSFQLGYPSQCKPPGSISSDFCHATRAAREEQAKKLQDRMSSAAGSDRLPRRDIMSYITACVVDACGGCPGTGPEWDQKVKTCSRLINKYLSLASSPFQNLNNRTSFFNPDNSQSTVHSLACHDGRVCVENSQLYSLFLPLLTATYRPRQDNSVEERLFNNEDNASPVLELVAQELAMHASGVVHVYVDNMADLSRIRNVIKVVMVYNRDVSHVEFHVSSDVNRDSVMAVIQRKVETWAGTVCNDRSRFTITPFSVHEIQQHRMKRSVERSEPRNKAKLDIRNWEMEWLLKL